MTSLYWTGKETQDPYWIQCCGYKFVNNSQINEEKKYIYNDHDIMQYSAKFNNQQKFQNNSAINWKKRNYPTDFKRFLEGIKFK